MYISRKLFFLRLRAINLAIDSEYFRIKRDLVSDTPRTRLEVLEAIERLENMIEEFRAEMKRPT